MSAHDIKSAQRPAPDAAPHSPSPLTHCNFTVASDVAYETARYCMMDTLACGFQCAEVPRLPQAPRSGGPRSCHVRRRARTRHLV